jgi:hypothetical protein
MNTSEIASIKIGDRVMHPISKEQGTITISNGKRIKIKWDNVLSDGQSLCSDIDWRELADLILLTNKK